MRCQVCGGEHETSACPKAGNASVPWASGPSVAFVPPAAQTDPLIGTQVGVYKILKLLGTGGMGSVYLGEHTGIGSRVAIKFLHEHLSSNADLVQRFYSEARSVNLIGHANIVGIFDMNVLPPNRYYLVMEYLEGRSLESLVMQGPVPMTRAIPILVQVCDALDQAHAAGVVHRDLKPENLMLVKRGRQEDFVKILDFGIAKLQGTVSNRKTATGIIIGTPDYMAPEQASGEGIDGRTDQYSLGVIAWELATGKTPFAGMPITSMLVAHLNQEPKSPHEVNPSVSKSVSAVILKALAKKPEARFATAGDFGQALEAALTQSISSGSSVLNPVSSDSIAQRVAPAPAPAPDQVSRATPVIPAVGTAGVRVDVLIKVEGAPVTHRQCQDLSRAACFVCSDDAPPPIFSRLTLTLPGAGPLEGDVVRHVTAQQAAAWKMPQGFAVQFLNPRPEQRDAIDQLMRPSSEGAALPEVPRMDDPLATKLLADVRKRIQGDHYQVLGVPLEVEVPQVKSRGRELMAQLAELAKRPLSVAQQKQVDTANERLRQAIDVLSTPIKRAEFDGNKFNWVGVGVCLSAGLRATELEELRKKFLKLNEGVESRIALQLMTADAHERDGHYTDALRIIEHSLNIDPLNLALHHRRKALLKRTPLRT